MQRVNIQARNIIHPVQINTKKPQGTVLYRSIYTSLMMIFRSKNNQANKATVSTVIDKFMQTQNPAVCTELDPLSLEMLTEVRQWMKFFKFGFIELTSQVRNYFRYENPNFIDWLLDVQNNIEYGNFQKGYERQLMRVKDSHGWSEQFVHEWVQRSIYMKQNGIELFKKSKGEPSKVQPQQLQAIKPPKRSSSSMRSKSQVQTEIGQQPTKKIKKDSLNYQAIVVSVQSMIRHSTTDQQKQQLQFKLNNFKSTSNIQYLQLLDAEAVKQLFEMRSYIKHFMVAFTQLTAKQQYAQFADKDMIYKVLKCQQYIDPSNVLESYRNIMEQNQWSLNWPMKMINKLKERIVELKNIEVQILSQR